MLLLFEQTIAGLFFSPYLFVHCAGCRRHKHARGVYLAGMKKEMVIHQANGAASRKLK